MHETVEIFLSLKNPMLILNLNNKLINQHEELDYKGDHLIASEEYRFSKVNNLWCGNPLDKW